MSVPSTLKCSLLTQCRSCAISTTAAKKTSAVACPSKQSWFLLKTLASKRVALVGIDIQEPLKEQVILEPFAKLPLAAHAIQSHQHLGREQPLQRTEVTASFVSIGASSDLSKRRKTSAIIRLTSRMGWVRGIRSSMFTNVRKFVWAVLRPLMLE